MIHTRNCRPIRQRRRALILPATQPTSALPLPDSACRGDRCGFVLQFLREAAGCRWHHFTGPKRQTAYSSKPPSDAGLKSSIGVSHRARFAAWRCSSIRARRVIALFRAARTRWNTQRCRSLTSLKNRGQLHLNPDRRAVGCVFLLVHPAGVQLDRRTGRTATSTHPSATRISGILSAVRAFVFTAAVTVPDTEAWRAGSIRRLRKPAPSKSWTASWARLWHSAAA